MELLSKYDKFVGQRIEVNSTSDKYGTTENVVNTDPVLAELTQLAKEDGMSVFVELKGWGKSADLNYQRINIRLDRRDGGHYISALRRG